MTDEHPPQTCGIRGCEREAIARLLDTDGAGLRCRPCLLTDLRV